MISIIELQKGENRFGEDRLQREIIDYFYRIINLILYFWRCFISMDNKIEIHEFSTGIEVKGTQTNWESWGLTG